MSDDDILWWHDELRKRHPSLLELTADERTYLEIADGGAASRTTLYWVAVWFIVVVFAFPYASRAAYQFAQGLAAGSIGGFLSTGLFGTDELLHTSAYIAGGLALLFGVGPMFLPSRDEHLASRQLPPHLARHIARSAAEAAAAEGSEIPHPAASVRVSKVSGAAFLIRMVLTYASAFAALLALGIHTTISKQTLQAALTIVITIPLVSAVGLACLLLIVPIALFRARREPETRAGVFRHLVYLLLDLEQFENVGAARAELRRSILAGIERVAYAISDLVSARGASNPVTLWAEREMHRAGQEFRAMAAWVHFPQSGTAEALRNKVIEYINIFAKGTLHDLPRRPLDPETAPFVNKPRTVQGLTRLLQSAIFFIIVAAPVAVSTLLPSGTLASVPPLAESGLIFLYGLWVLIAAVTLAERIAPSAKDSVIDLLKLLLQK